jgi:hypothetical protein
MNVKKQIEEMKEKLAVLKDGLFCAFEFGDFSVVLGDNEIYYLGLIDVDTKCISNCESDEECICTRKFPNSYSFYTIDEVANFIVLNYFDGQAAYQNKSEMK